ncbi:hypothetical protein SNE40_011264 [Patella caerulea]|uniref:G-protein coupled receptors family 1 profile domain-containing protein n=1 Tax=Patella caerulea TaxID=87958 RepID=A0AAN8PTQ8_PATCE
MDQFAEYVSYKTWLHKSNFTYLLQPSYNFSGADDILRDFEASFYTFSNYTTVILLTLYIPTFIVALVGNILIILTVFADKTVRKTKNIYLINLAVSDLCITLFCMPITVGTIVYRMWVYGEFLCKFTAFLPGVAVASSIFTLTAMSIDRYISIQHPTRNHWVTTPAQAVGIIFGTWLVSSILMGPIMYIRQIDTLSIPSMAPMKFCIENWPQDYDRQAFSIFLLFVIYVIPSFTLAVCYGHVGRALCTKELVRDTSNSSTERLFSRKKAAKMLILLVIIFMICWLPYNILSLCIDLTQKGGSLSMLPFSLWLGHAHSAINPVMYWSLNRRFRDRVRGLMKYIRNSNAFMSNPGPEFV